MLPAPGKAHLTTINSREARFTATSTFAARNARSAIASFFFHFSATTTLRIWCFRFCSHHTWLLAPSINLPIITIFNKLLKLLALLEWLMLSFFVKVFLILHYVFLFLGFLVVYLGRKLIL